MIGFDDLNDYYDVTLEEDRLRIRSYELESDGAMRSRQGGARAADGEQGGSEGSVPRAPRCCSR